MTKIQNINFFGQIMLQLDDFSRKTRSKLELCLKNAKLQLWWLLLIFGFYPRSFEGSYLSHGWEKIFSAGLIQKSIKDLSGAREFCPVSSINGAKVISQSIVKIVFFGV